MPTQRPVKPPERRFSLAVPDYFGKQRLHGRRLRLYEIIFESDTPAGRTFDVVLILVILASVAVVLLESIAAIQQRYGGALLTAEWVFTILFTLEYVLRLVCVGRPLRYATSFFGIVDLLAVIPTYLSVLVPGARFLLVIRLLRVLRVFRVLKLAAYLSEASVLLRALRNSRRKIELFIVTVLTIVVIIGSLMYLIEGAENGFTSIPRSIYWAIVTLTTVGYGDISPQTNLGQVLAAIIMIIGYGIIAVPTGIVTSELTRIGYDDAAAAAGEAPTLPLTCPNCGTGGHRAEARYCWQCGSGLH